MRIRLHAIELASRANGPGLRAVVWLQGCTLGCAGCFNPGTHDAELGYDTSSEDIAAALLGAPDVEGISISGGEPFQQPEALLALVRRVRETPLSVLVFSGYTLEAIRATPLGTQILSCVDVLIAGRYAESKRMGQSLIGSANQRLHLLTARYTPADFGGIPASEVILHRDGSVTLSGIRNDLIRLR